MIARLGSAFCRAADWLTSAGEIEPQVREELISGLIQRRPAVYFSCVAILIMSGSAAWLIAAPWTFAWFGLDLSLLAARLYLSFRYDRGDGPREKRGLVVTVMFGVFMTFGAGGAVCFALGPPVLMAMASISIMGVFAGMVTRWSGFPRLALLTIGSLSAMVAIALAEREGGSLILAAVQFLAIAGTTAAQAVQNHFNLVRMIRAEQGNWLMARCDPLTGLFNRVKLMEMLERACAGLDADPFDRSRHFALLYIDLDGFKAVNDSLGHDGGDRLLESIGRTLAAVLRRDQNAYRVGGDEFVILAEGAGEEEASRLAGRIIAALAARQGIAVRAGCRISASIGVALACTDGAAPHALLAEADAALYFAKRQGKSCFHLYGTEEVPLLRAC